MTRPRRPLSKRASTASCSIRFSLRMMISGALRSMSRFSRLFRLITRQRVQVHVAQELADRFGAHADLQALGAVLVLELARLVDRDQVLLLHALDTAVENDVLLEVQDLLQLAQRHVQELADAAR